MKTSDVVVTFVNKEVSHVLLFMIFIANASQKRHINIPCKKLHVAVKLSNFVTMFMIPCFSVLHFPIKFLLSCKPLISFDKSVTRFFSPISLANGGTGPSF